MGRRGGARKSSRRWVHAWISVDAYEWSKVSLHVVPDPRRWRFDGLKWRRVTGVRGELRAGDPRRTIRPKGNPKVYTRGTPVNLICAAAGCWKHFTAESSRFRFCSKRCARRERARRSYRRRGEESYFKLNKGKED